MIQIGGRPRAEEDEMSFNTANGDPRRMAPSPDDIPAPSENPPGPTVPERVPHAPGSPGPTVPAPDEPYAPSPDEPGAPNPDEPLAPNPVEPTVPTPSEPSPGAPEA
jgi:hypothetical protein